MQCTSTSSFCHLPKVFFIYWPKVATCWIWEPRCSNVWMSICLTNLRSQWRGRSEGNWNKMRILLQLLVVSRFDSSNRDKQRREKRGKMRKGRIHVIHCLGVFAAVATIGRKWCSLPKVAPPTLFCTLTSSHFKSNKNLGTSFDQQLIRGQFVGKQCNCRTAQSLKNKLQDLH